MPNSKFEEEKKETEPISLESAVEILRALRQKEQETKPEETVERALQELPTDARERLQAKLNAEREDLLAEGIDEAVASRIIAKRAEKEALTFREAYEDKRFTVGNNERMPKDAYAKAEIQDEMDKIFSNKPKKEDLEKIARLSFDANGLKAVNDLTASHKKGDEFLRRIAKVFHDPEGPTRKWLKEKGVTKILATTGGGDEYGVMLVADQPISKEVIDEAIRRFENEVSAIPVSDLLDVEDPEVILRIGNVPDSEIKRMSKEERAAKVKEIKEKEIPEGFKFRATVAGGGATLAEGLKFALEEAKPDNRLYLDKDNYRRALEKIMGGIWDVADKKGADSKKTFKEMLNKSGDPKEKFYGLLLTRTAEEKRLAEENAKLSEEVKKRQDLIEVIKKEVEIGMPPEKILELIKSFETPK